MRFAAAIDQLNAIKFPLTNEIIPTWANFEGLSTRQKIEKVIKDLFKTLICCSIIVPLITTSIDLFFTKKKPIVIKVTLSDSHSGNTPAVIAKTKVDIAMPTKEMDFTEGLSQTHKEDVPSHDGHPAEQPRFEDVHERPPEHVQERLRLRRARGHVAEREQQEQNSTS